MDESPLFVRAHDFLFWLLPQLQKFPRIYRFTLSERIQCTAMGFQDLLIAAGKAKNEERKNYLKEADIALEQLRFWLRLSSELGLFSLGQYEHAARMLVEVGRLLGGWIKQT